MNATLTNDLKFDDASHTYRLDGTVLPNVTSIISWLNNYAGVPSDILERARELGTAVHETTALDDRNDLDESSVHELVRPYLGAWRQFRNDTGFIVELCEQRVHSVKHKYAGTLDRVGFFPALQEPALLDLKATAKVMPANGPQTAAYKQCLIESGYPSAPTLTRYTVLLCPDRAPPYRIVRHTDAQDFSVFLYSLALHTWKTNNGFKN